MSATRALRIPARDPELGRTPTLERLRRSKGLIVAGLADALDLAAAIGIRPQRAPLPEEVGALLPTGEIESLLAGIARRLAKVEESLDALDAARARPGSFPQQEGLLDFYGGSMRAEVDLAKLHLAGDGTTIDIAAVARAVETMADITRDFVATVQAWATRVTEEVAGVARQVRERVGRTLSGVRATASWAARTMRRRRFEPSMRDRETKPAASEIELRRALDRGKVAIAYRLIVSLEDRSVAGLQALVRWDSPGPRQTLPPEFAESIGDIGLLFDLWTFILARIASQLASWQRAERRRAPLFVGINVPSRRLLEQDFVTELGAVVARAGLARGTLRLELAEPMVLENPERSAQVLRRLRALGIGLVLDRFGTGPASLHDLQRFPFDMVKIDESFVRPGRRGVRPAILRSMVALAHDLGMEVVAEGADADADMIELYQIGCEYTQVPATGEPMSWEAADRLIRTQ
jgi:EAL domain-containing protein (putative c-di-GMP-specific phosphodiesterase class I)